MQESLLTNTPRRKLASLVMQGKWIVPVRFLVRAKVFQLIGAGAVGLAAAGITVVGHR